MRLTHICIDHFRNLEDIVLPVDGLQVFVGPNGAGKSSLLEAVHWLSDSSDQDEPFEIFGGYRVYEVDDSLAGDLVGYGSFDDSEGSVPLLRSLAVFNLGAAFVGHSLMQGLVSEEQRLAFGPTHLRLDVPGFEKALAEAEAIFRCPSESVLIDHLNEDPSPVLDGLRERFKALSALEDRWLDRDRRPPGYRSVGERMGNQAEPIGQREGLDGLHYRAAGHLLELVKQSNRFAWAPCVKRETIRDRHGNVRHVRTWGYAGVVVARSEVSNELKGELDKLSETFNPREFEDGYCRFGDVTNTLENELEAWGEIDRPTVLGGPEDYPSLVEVVRQWALGEPYLRVSIQPFTRPLWGRQRTEPLLDTVDEASKQRGMNLAIRDMLTNFDAPDDSPRRSLRDLHFGMRRASSRNPAGIPRFETASDDGDPAVLKNELESGIAELHNHLWTPLTETGLGGRPTLDYRNADFPEVMGEPARHGFEIDLDDSTPWLVPQHRPFQRFQRRVGMLRHQRVISEQELGTAYVVRPSIPPVLALLAYRSNQLAPPFLVFAGTITIDLKPVVEWTPLDRLAVQFDGKPLDELPSGWQRWVAITLRTAFRSLMQSEVWIPPLESGEAGEETDEREGIRRHAAAVMEDPQTAPQVFEVSPPTHGRTVLLIDEPEVHLHPDAASEVKEWLTGELADNGSSALVATHAPVFMDYRPDEATVYGLEPWGSRPDVDGADRGTRMYEASGNFVEWVEQCGSSLGISTFGALTFYRGFLLVEGPHDEEVIRHFYGDLLDSHRIGLVVLWGLRDEREARRLAESRFLKYAHKPVAVLLDNATLERVRDPSAAPRDITYEEHQLRRFMDEFDRARIPLHPASHGLTDIVAALPEEAVRRHLADDDVVGTFEGGWEEVESEIRRGPSLKSVDKKRKVQELLGLRVTTYGYSLDNLIKPVLDHSDGLRPTRPLEVAMEGVMAWFEDDGSRPR